MGMSDICNINSSLYAELMEPNDWYENILDLFSPKQISVLNIKQVKLPEYDWLM